jgi:hypothetical protein
VACRLLRRSRASKTMATTRQQAVMTAQQHMLGVAKLTGTYMQ